VFQGKNHLTLTGFIEKLWAKFGHHRKGKKVNNLPFPQGESCLKEQRLDDRKNIDLAESAFFSNVDLIGTGRDEQIANVAWQISYNFPPEYTWNLQVFEDLRRDAAHVSKMLDRDTFQNPGM
jgi:hypothetical protein